MLWNVMGDCVNYAVLKGTQGAVMQVSWMSVNRLVSCSSDKTVAMWDAETAVRIRKWRGHAAIVNSCDTAGEDENVVLSCSDDASWKLWDARQKNAILNCAHQFPLTACCLSLNGTVAYVAGVDNVIRAYDLRNNVELYSLTGHADTITGLRISPDSSFLLSSAMDNLCIIWDIRPFTPSSTRLLRVFEGAPHGFEKNLIRPAWSADASMVACGSADRTVVIWDALSTKILYKLPGHKGCVNQVDFHPSEPIIASCSSDRQIFLGEL